MCYCIAVFRLCAGIEPVLPAAAEARYSAARKDQPGFEKVGILCAVSFYFFEGQQLTRCLCCVKPKGCNINRYLPVCTGISFCCVRSTLYSMASFYGVY